MTRSVAELEILVKNAWAARQAAATTHDQLSAELRDARLAESGLAGHKVSFPFESGWGRTHRKTVRTFLVEAVTPDRLFGRAIRADGTLGSMRWECNPRTTELTDHGVYVAPTTTETP